MKFDYNKGIYKQFLEATTEILGISPERIDIRSGASNSLHNNITVFVFKNEEGVYYNLKHGEYAYFELPPLLEDFKTALQKASMSLTLDNNIEAYFDYKPNIYALFQSEVARILGTTKDHIRLTKNLNTGTMKWGCVTVYEFVGTESQDMSNLKEGDYIYHDLPRRLDLFTEKLTALKNAKHAFADGN